MASTPTDAEVKAQKTLAEIHKQFAGVPTVSATDLSKTIEVTDSQVTTYNTGKEEADQITLAAGTYNLPVVIAAVEDNALTQGINEAEAAGGNGMVSINDYDADYDTDTAESAAGYDAVKATAAEMRNFLLAAQVTGNQAATDATDDPEYQYKTAYDNLVKSAETAATTTSPVVPGKTAAENRATATAGQNVTIERDAWMVSGKIKFGGPVDFRFSYMDADDLEVSCGSCSGDWDETAAQAWNVGVFYTMPAGTELRLTYSEVDNDDNGTYGQGISGTGLGGVGVPGGAGGEIEMFAVGIVHWFD